MHRAVLQACFPWFIWLCVASGLMLLLLQVCGGRCDWRRLRRLQKSEEGAVQSLSLVLTLPVFLLLVLFIVQVTQIMVGIMMVNYAAFAAARSASVWIPSDVTTDTTFKDRPFESRSSMNFWILDPKVSTDDFVPTNSSVLTPNSYFGLTMTDGPLEGANVVAGTLGGSSLSTDGSISINATTGAASYKYQKMVLAAVIPCLTISPSRKVDTGPLPSQLQNTYSTILKLYPQVDPKSKSNLQLPARLLNKLGYSAKFTTVDLTWVNVPHPLPDNAEGPTYNPYQHPSPSVPMWNRNEVGFRDPVTIVVKHQFALLPGIGHILWKSVAQPGASQSAQKPAEDKVANRITRHSGSGDELYTIELEASATFVNEGYKSIIRYAVQP
ncbi:MAG: hypothetical protein V4719_05785 [Planctomycetota bacterium]